MTRPRQFDEQEVRDRIADVFIAHGFRGTSLSMLTDAAGVGKQGLYNAFGDKQTLYLQSLERAADRMAGAKAVMDACPTGRAAIEAFFAGLVQLCAHPDPVMNTCIVSAGLLEGGDDPVVTHKLCEKWDAAQVLLAAAVARGQADGSMRGNVDPAVWARLLMTLMSGLRVTARAVRDETALQQITQLALQPLWTDP